MLAMQTQRQHPFTSLPATLPFEGTQMTQGCATPDCAGLACESLIGGRARYDHGNLLVETFRSVFANSSRCCIVSQNAE